MRRSMFYNVTHKYIPVNITKGSLRMVPRLDGTVELWVRGIQISLLLKTLNLVRVLHYCG